MGAARKYIPIILLLGAGVMLALNLPGQMSYDSISQLYQGRTGLYNSWHPPVMAWLLGLFDSLWRGPALFVLFDTALLIGGWCLLLDLTRSMDWRAGAVAVLILLTPQFLLYQGIVWKDVLFANAAIAGFAALAIFAARPQWIWPIASALLLSLAALTRQNGLLLLPAGAVTLGWIRAQRGHSAIAPAAILLAAMLLLTGGASWVLTIGGDGGDGANAEIRLAQTYDMIGALKADPGLTLPLLDQQDPAFANLMRQDGVRLYSANGTGSLSGSPPLADAISDAPNGLIFAQWEGLLRNHPGLYLALRWPVFVAVLATPELNKCFPVFTGVTGNPDQLRTLGLVPRLRPQDRWLAAYAGHFVGTPILSHLAFLALALGLLAGLLWRRRGPDIAMAGMLAGALVFTASFYLVSLSCDYRYLYFLDLSAMTAALYWAASCGTDARRP